MLREQSFTIDTLSRDHAIPYDLLLLADPKKEKIDGYIHRSQVYVARLNLVIIAVCVLYICSETHEAEIMNIAVHENYHRRGVGTLLLKVAFQTAKAAGAAGILIKTGNSSTGQLNLYQRLGFKITAVNAGYFTRNYRNPIYENGILCQDQIVLERDL